MKIKSKLENIVGAVTAVDEDNDIILLGDFNAHVGIVGPQELNINGCLLLDLMETYNLILLNNDENCVGEITRSCRGERSTIDFVLVNTRAYNKFECMVIDEDKLQFDNSVHCMIRVDFKLKKMKNNKIVKHEYIEYYFWKREQSHIYLKY